MRFIVGYGFSPRDIKNREFLQFSKTYDGDFFEEQYEDAFGSKDIKPIEEMSEEEVVRMMDNLLMDYTPAGYIAMVINTEENFSGRINGEEFLAEIDGFTGIESICFSGGSEERLKKVRNSDDFDKIIRSYFPDSEITFGLIFGGNDWESPNYGLGE
jgi:hypothetical protein